MNIRKSLLTVCVLALAGQAQAQKLGFVNGTETVADGSTIVCESAIDPFFPTGKKCATGALALKNYSGEDIDCTVTLTLQDNTLSSSNEAEICMGGTCVAVKSWPFSKSFSAGAGKSVLAQYDVTPTQYGEMNSTLTVKGAGESHSVYVKFVNPDPTGIKSVGTLDVSTSYDVFSLTGRRIAKGMGASEVNGMKKGIYLVKETKTGKTVKIVLK